MSGIFSIVSHSTLQYLPEVVRQEQMGCAHFFGFAVSMAFLPALDQESRIQDVILGCGRIRFCTLWDKLRIKLAEWAQTKNVQ
jgi:hypothetical protein